MEPTSIPNIRCSSCGAIIGHKFIRFNMLIECGATKLEAFEALDIYLYCCRSEFTHPIILPSKSVCDQKFSPVPDTKNNSGKIIRIPIRTEHASQLEQIPTINHLTRGLTKEITVVSLSHSNSTGEDALIDLREHLAEIVAENYIEFQKKEIDPNAILTSTFRPNRSVFNVGSGYQVDYNHRVYSAT